MNARRPNPFTGFNGSMVIKNDVFFRSDAHSGLRLVGNGPPERLLAELEPREFLYACISDECSPGMVTLCWVERGAQIHPGMPVVAYYGITDAALLDLHTCA